MREVGIADAFEVILDSKRVGIEKPDPRIFELALDQLHTHEQPRVHIGDSYTADVAGALAAGWNAIWYGRRAIAVDDPRIAIATNAAMTRAALSAFGV
ncbi:MAG: HAD-IA family hydrolase [Kofleriaceae bacterium]